MAQIALNALLAVLAPIMAQNCVLIAPEDFSAWWVLRLQRHATSIHSVPQYNNITPLPVKHVLQGGGMV